MKTYIQQLMSDVGDPIARRNWMREYLQARILGVLQHAGAMIPLAFHGGTALRLLFALPRYSEDLDFALEQPGAGYDFRGYLEAIRDEFTMEGYDVRVRLRKERAVNNAFVSFSSLLYEFGLSPHRDEVLAVKIDVDTTPPAGAGLDTTIVRRHLTLNLQHHDRASLLAGKLHAILQRRYVKGRDLYDLMWYLSDSGWPPPNLRLLRNALAQTGWEGATPDEGNWREMVWKRLENLDWKRAVMDVRPFLERGAEVDLLSRVNFEKLLGK